MVSSVTDMSDLELTVFIGRYRDVCRGYWGETVSINDFAYQPYNSVIGGITLSNLFWRKY